MRERETDTDIETRDKGGGGDKGREKRKEREREEGKEHTTPPTPFLAEGQNSQPTRWLNMYIVQRVSLLAPVDCRVQPHRLDRTGLIFLRSMILRGPSSGGV